MNKIYEASDIVDGRLRKDAVSQIEDVTWSPFGPIQDVPGFAFHDLRARKQHGGVQVPLNAPVVSDAPPCLV